MEKVEGRVRKMKGRRRKVPGRCVMTQVTRFWSADDPITGWPKSVLKLRLVGTGGIDIETR